MSEEVVGLARKDGRLVAIVSVRKDEEQDGAVARFELVERGADEAVVRVRPELVRAVEAWRALREPDWSDPAALSSALIVLLETVPLGGARAGPTAAGQAALCSRNVWPRLREALRVQAREVFPRLREAGYRADVVSLVGARDPYLAYHHGVPAEPGLQSFPPSFVAFVLPGLRPHPWPVVRRALSVFWSLGLDRDAALLALAVRVLTEGPEHGLAWLELLAKQGPSHAPKMARILLQSGAVTSDPQELSPEILDEIGARGDSEHADRFIYLLRALRNGVAPAHALEGFRIADAFVPGHRFSTHGPRQPAKPHPGRPARAGADLWRLLERFQRGFAPDWESTFPIRLWKWSASSPERAAVLQRPSLHSWPVLTAFRILWRLVHDEVGRWSECERVSVAERLLVSIPESHQAKAVDALSELFTRGLDAAHFAAACDLVVRLARPPFRSRCSAEWMSGLLAEAAGPHLDRLAQVPERSMQRLERALCEDHSWLVRNGLASLGAVASGFLLEALIAHPEPLIAAARQLGVLSEPRRRTLLKRLRSHPVSQRRFAKRPLDQVYRTLEGLVRRGLPNPIPRKLREHLAGAGALSAGSLERHRQAIERRLLPFRISLLRQMALEEMGRGVDLDVSSDSERHAVQMLGSVPSNRRLLRRVLRVRPAERRAFLDRHPANQAWLARHPRLRGPLWRTGLRDEAALSDGSTLRLAFETDPLEVLRMGTLVGSCLSVGGVCSSSAVGVMAAANKRVIFARAAAGAFVARQLVAVTEDDRLLFFPVYPLITGEAVRDAFEQYDLKLAWELGLEICRDPDQEYAVAPVLGGSVYDDGPWIRLVRESA